VLLGILSACMGIVFALVKYMSTVYVSGLREKLQQTRNDLNKANTLFQAMDAKFKVAENRHANERKKTEHTRTRHEGLYLRLGQELPASLQATLELCQTRFPLPDRKEAQVIQDLQLDHSTPVGASDSPSDLTLLVIVFADDSLTSECQIQLENNGGRVRRLEDSCLVGIFDSPVAGFGAFVSFAGDLSLTAPSLRSVLYSTAENAQGKSEKTKSDPDRLSARLLKQARQVIADAPDNILLLNQEVYDALDDTSGIEEFDSVHQLYSYSWSLTEDES
jgi:hypothetical protein